MRDYLITYCVSQEGDSLDLLYISPPSQMVEDLYYEGGLLREIWLGDNGIFEMRIRVTDNDQFGIISLEKTCWRV